MRARTALELAGRGALRPPACGARLLCAAARPPIRDLAERAAASAAGAREVAHWCEALAKAQPSPFLPLHVPRQKRAGGAEAEDAAVTRPPRSWFRRPLDKATVAYASERGRAMLGDVVGDERGGAAFLDVMSAFDMQRHPVSCGVASLTIALNVLRLAPWRAGTRAAVPGGSALDGEDEEEFDMVTEDEIVKALFREGERKSLDAAGVSLQTLADVALRVDGIHVECRYAHSGGSAGGFSEAEFRQVSERSPPLPALFARLARLLVTPSEGRGR